MSNGFNMQIDPIVAQFAEVYGIRDLIENVGLEKIRKVGSYYMALCPFHDNTREPDFQIHKDLGLYNCFGCEAKGNLYGFVALTYNLSYTEANEFIAKLAGFDSSVNVEDIKFRANLRNKFKSEENDKQLTAPPITDGVIARMNTGPDPYKYLLGRGFSEDTINYFECTFTNQWTVWDDEKEDFAYQERVVIPGHWDNGELCGFIGRTPVNDTPKYKYTRGYPKSTSLFNLHRASKYLYRKPFCDGLILVEGSLDVMQITQLGYPNVVGIYGARVHDAQAELVMRYADKVYLMFDNDDAGRKAMMSGIEAFRDKLDLNIIPLGNFKDPGEIPNRTAFEALLHQSLSWFQFNLKFSF